MEVKKWQEAKRWLTRPKAKPMPITKYIDTMNRLYGSDGGNADPDKDPRYIDPKEMLDIKKSLPVSEMVKKEERFNDKILKRDKYETPKKKIIKKTLIVEKPKPKPTYLNGNVIDITPIIDDEWWRILDIEPPKEESRLLLVPKSKAEGITSILNLHKKFVG